MDFKIIDKVDALYDIEFVPCFSSDTNSIYGDKIKALKELGEFKGKKGTSYEITLDNEKLTKVIFIGLGDKDSLTYEDAYKALTNVFKSIKGNKHVVIHSFSTDKISLRDAYKCIILSLNGSVYTFNKYFSDKKEINVNAHIVGEKEDIGEFIDISESLNLARDLVNEPANVLTPNELGERCKKELSGIENVEVCVYDEAWILENGLKALYEVSKASVNKARFIVIRYTGNKDSDKTISFVGKGLTYDSGGYSIKSTDGMVTMKCDMGGAGSVLALMKLISKRKLKINAYGILPTCENLISGNGFKPGDVISSLSGKTIEIISTDAEGRLVLADGVYYAADKLNTDMIIDIATLTGACGIALGTKYAAVVDNDESIFNSLKDASSNTVESIWRLPGDKEYLDTLKSNIADLKNIGGRYGGTITAGLFVGEFVKDKPWAHIDIAYVAWNDAPSKIFPHKGGTGASVELLYNFCKNNQK